MILLYMVMIKKLLRKWSDLIKEFLKDNLKLYMSKCRIFSTSKGVDFLGYKAFHTGKVILRRSTAKQVRAKIKNLWYNYDRLDKNKMLSSVGSRLGWLRKANTYNFILALEINSLSFKIRRDLKRGL